MLIDHFGGVPAKTEEGVDRVIADARARVGALMCLVQHVSPTYYEWTLQRRRDVLWAPSTAHLCKALVCHNTRFDDDGENTLHTHTQLHVVQERRVACRIESIHARNPNRPPLPPSLRNRSE